MRLTTITTIAMLMALVFSAAQGFACTINLVKTKPDAKTFYLPNGDSFTSKNIEKLTPYCDFKMRTMTAEEYKEFKINRLKRQLSKLQASDR